MRKIEMIRNSINKHLRDPAGNAFVHFVHTLKEK